MYFLNFVYLYFYIADEQSYQHIYKLHSIAICCFYFFLS